MKFVLVQRCGRINIEDIRKAEHLEWFKDKAKSNGTIERCVIGYIADTCRKCPHSKIEDIELIRQNMRGYQPDRGKQIKCPQIVLNKSGKIPIGWVGRQ